MRKYSRGKEKSLVLTFQEKSPAVHVQQTTVCVAFPFEERRVEFSQLLFYLVVCAMVSTSPTLPTLPPLPSLLKTLHAGSDRT
jgi:hypothetical protein